MLKILAIIVSTMFFATVAFSQIILQKPVVCSDSNTFKEFVKQNKLRTVAVSETEDIISVLMVSERKDLVLFNIFKKEGHACLIDIMENVETDLDLGPKISL